MKFTAAHQSRTRAAPVILAANPLHGLWPRSTASHPYSLMPDRNGTSPVGRLCSLFHADALFAPPLVIVTESALEAALDATSDCRAKGARLVIVPADSRNGVSAVLSAILATRKGDDTPLVFVPATLEAPSGSELTTLFHTAGTMASRARKAIAFVRRARAQDREICIESGDRHPSGFRQAERALAPEGDAGEAAREMGALQALAGPVVVGARHFLDIVAGVQPTLLQGCANALALGETEANVIRPHSGYLSLFAGAAIADVIAARPREVLLHPAGESMKVVRSWLDLPVDATYVARGRVANDDAFRREVSSRAPGIADATQ